MSARPKRPAGLQFQPEGTVLRLQGVIDFANATQVLRQGLDWLRGQTAAQLGLDLSGLTGANTLTLAVVMQWQRQLRAGQTLQLQGVPERLEAIIRASHLDCLLPAG